MLIAFDSSLSIFELFFGVLFSKDYFKVTFIFYFELLEVLIDKSRFGLVVERAVLFVESFIISEKFNAFFSTAKDDITEFF